MRFGIGHSSLSGHDWCCHHSWEQRSGTGKVRHQEGTTEIEPSDAFVFKPGEPHQLVNDGAQDLVLYVVADNPIGESTYYPDSKKWIVRSPEPRIIRSEDLDYFDGEE